MATGTASSYAYTVTIEGTSGNDTLTVDLSGGNLFPFTGGGLIFHGNDPTSGPGDKLVITGGTNQGTTTYNYTSAHDGSVGMSNFFTVNYTGLEPITNDGTASNVVFNLPDGSGASLQDTGATRVGRSQRAECGGSPVAFLIEHVVLDEIRFIEILELQFFYRPLELIGHGSHDRIGSNSGSLTMDAGRPHDEQ